jgi:hypothetical protein
MSTKELTEAEYFDSRLEDQINWYSGKSSHCQKRYKTLRVVEIISASLIPLLSGFGDKVPHGPWVIGFLGVVIAICTAIAGLFKYHENWIQYRSTSEALKHEKYLFLTRVAPYDGEGRFPNLVQRIESLISNENSTWTQTIASDKNSSNNNQ